MKNPLRKERNTSRQQAETADTIRQIKKRAHALWLGGAFNHGIALRTWLEAEREVTFLVTNLRRKSQT